jgi:hypothetical protein
MNPSSSIRYTIIYILIISIIIYYITSYLESGLEHFDNPEKPYLWVYWELKPGASKPPDYISLCLKIMKNKSYLFNLVLLDNHNIYDYLPDLRRDINNLPIALKTDYIRVALLYKYGGLWLDADTIVMSNLQPIIDLLNMNTDFIGFGCTGMICKNNQGYSKPSNGAMAAIKNSKLMKLSLDKLDKKLDESHDFKNFKYFDLGKLILWDSIKELEQNNYKYYHFDTNADGSRDKYGHWVAPDLIFNKNIEYDNPDKLLFIFLANSYYCGDDKKYNWFCKLTEKEIISGDYYISKLFRKALN